MNLNAGKIIKYAAIGIGGYVLLNIALTVFGIVFNIAFKVLVLALIIVLIGYFLKKQQ